MQDPINPTTDSTQTTQPKATARLSVAILAAPFRKEKRVSVQIDSEIKRVPNKRADPKYKDFYQILKG